MSDPGATRSPAASPVHPGALRAVLFDMDGVIVDTEPLHEAALIGLYAARGWPVADPKFFAFKGRVPPDVFGEIAATFGGDAGLHAADKHVLFEALFEAHAALVPGARAFVESVRARGLAAALVTSARRSEQARVFERFALGGLFAKVVAAEDVTRAKPDPEPYLAGAARLGVPPGACLVVEDSVHGVASGVAAGCTVAGYTGTFPADALRAAGAHVTFGAFDDLAAWLWPGDPT